MANKDNTFLKQAKKNGFSLDDGFRMVGFVLDNLSASQIAHLCVENTNKWLESNFGTNFSVFYEENSMPCIQPCFARFHAKDAMAFYGHLIATSFSTAFSIKDATRSKRYYYINDLEWTRPWFRHNQDDIDKVLNNDEIVKFTRSNDHYKYLTDMGINVIPNIVEDFDINKILEIINGNER
jgi:hypothetical protein